MSNRYDKVMKNIEVTPDMHDRIMGNIHRLDISKQRGIAVLISNHRRVISLVACFAVLVAGAFVVGNWIHFPGEPLVQTTPDIVSCASPEELSKAVGFNAGAIQNIPFEIQEVKYTAYWEKLAQIEYTGRDNSIVFRKSAGSEDISGDYTEYSEAKDCNANGQTVTIKGDKAQYHLAVWVSGGFSYSVYITNGVSEAEILEIANSIK